MTSPVRPPVLPPNADPAQRLRRAASDLEGVFVEQMLKAMRETVPEGGLTSAGSAEEMFTALLDQHLASRVPSQMGGGLAETLVHQLRAAFGASPDRPRATP